MKESRIIKGIPSSFVFKNMKLDTDTGKGEAKLFVGPTSQLAEINDFFKFDQDYRYSFVKSNLLEYLREVKMEYVFQCINKYKNASVETWQELYSTILNMQDSEMAMKITKYDDGKRVYVRSEEDIFNKVFRKIIVPKLTDAEFIRDDDDKTLSLFLRVNYEYKVDKNIAVDEISYKTELKKPFSCNRIIFGAPGTGKSFTINNDRKDLLGENNETDYERVTFHPDYSYANFVGTYKPVPCKKRNDKGEEEDSITYEYVPGPFMRMYVKALRNARTDSPKPFLLIIEEINRANVAAVFGDVFQLLDRGDDNVSEYPIQASEDIKKYLARELGGDPESYSKIRIPDNMFIWATMNSADQGVYPMDTAFKRRWDFTYLGIDDSDKDIRDKYVYIAGKKVIWNELRKAINEFLADNKINEDKQLGPYFIARNIVVPMNGDSEIDSDKFCKVFKNKVLMYLFEDAAKQKRPSLFGGCKEGCNRYSKICEAFDKKGIDIFLDEISRNSNVLSDENNAPESNENDLAREESDE
ncbi:MAG: AAA family ATPase [Ruminococcus sp.]|nr:AAA family ATPase [Ruminococcus sp.]